MFEGSRALVDDQKKRPAKQAGVPSICTGRFGKGGRLAI